jgi:hypothetical protein
VSWIAQAALGVVWTVCGVVIGLSPPLSETGRGAASPFVGWLVVGLGIVLVVSGFRRAGDPPSGTAKHSSGREADRRNEIRLPLAVVICAVIGAGCMWWGLASERAAIVCFGVISGSFGVVAAPHAVEALRGRLRK